MNKTDQDLVSAFLAKKAVTRVAEGEGLRLTNRQWYRKSTDDGIMSGPSHEQRAEQAMERAREENGYYKS